ncbi:hypothetical protein MNBD_PLANCTO03-1099 [hydrothermal vent metagenome]|uniref:RNA polymerase sigma factor n=1 Tax=hydrothermal vent metagenome TaxID=652676 RepID=A0A3B1E182_9ZZZZ
MPTTTTTTDDRTLLRKTHAGDDPAARELWHRHAGWMLAYARTLVGNRHSLSPDDVVQSVFCRLLALDRRTLRSVREVRPWLAQLIRHEAFNQLRTARRAVQRDASTRPPRPPVGPSAEPPCTTSELAEAMKKLPRRQREVIHLRHIAGMTTDQTAQVLGVPRGTAASRYGTAMGALRGILDSATTPPSPPFTPAEPPFRLRDAHLLLAEGV